MARICETFTLLFDGNCVASDVLFDNLITHFCRSNMYTAWADKAHWYSVLTEYILCSRFKCVRSHMAKANQAQTRHLLLQPRLLRHLLSYADTGIQSVCACGWAYRCILRNSYLFNQVSKLIFVVFCVFKKILSQWWGTGTFHPPTIQIVPDHDGGRRK